MPSAKARLATSLPMLPTADQTEGLAADLVAFKSSSCPIFRLSWMAVAL